MKARKKPVEVEVFHLVDLSDQTVFEALKFMDKPFPIYKSLNGRDEFKHFLHKCWEQNGISISTPEGVMKAKPSDYIIKGVNGEFYPCSQDVFEKTYEVLK